MSPNQTIVYVGTVGFSYEAWGKGTFYPQVLPRSEWLTHYSQFFNSVEISHSFSKAPDKDTYLNWYAQTGADFRFSLRGNQYITHVKKLKGVGEPLKLFLEPALKLREKLSAVVWEIPNLGKDQYKLLEAFSKHLKKYSSVQHYFDFNKEMALEQKTLQLLQDQEFEIIAKIPDDSLFQNKHYFRISQSPHEKKKNEWEKDLVQKIQKDATEKPYFLFFEDPQGGLSVKNAQVFLSNFPEKKQRSL